VPTRTARRVAQQQPGVDSEVLVEVAAEGAVGLAAAVEDDEAGAADLLVVGAEARDPVAATRHRSSAIAPGEHSNRSKGRPSTPSATRPLTLGLLP
jgi:hypothetical protein